MRQLFQNRPMRFIFAANLVSMFGSGMNSHAVIWYILKSTNSEAALGLLIMLQTLPALAMMPFTGVIIDREDRRKLVMILDAARAAVILAVAVLAFTGRVQIWQVYLMNVLVAAGFWMFWPSVTALIQEMTPESEMMHANTFLLAAIQAGFLLSGAIVGFVYNSIGLGGVLLIDTLTYAVSFACYFAVRKGTYIVERPDTLANELREAETTFARFWRELLDGFRYLRGNRFVVLTGLSWSLFLGAMLTQNVITAPLVERVLHAGAIGYGWLNMGWGAGAFLSAAYTSWAINRLGGRPATALSMAIMALCLFMAPFSASLAVAALIYTTMGSARGVGGTAINTALMESVPKHFMGRVSNTFLFIGTLLQLALGFFVGQVAHNVGVAFGFLMIGSVYTVAALLAVVPAHAAEKAETTASV